MISACQVHKTTVQFAWPEDVGRIPEEVSPATCLHGLSLLPECIELALGVAELLNGERSSLWASIFDLFVSLPQMYRSWVKFLSKQWQPR